MKYVYVCVSLLLATLFSCSGDKLQSDARRGDIYGRLCNRATGTWFANVDVTLQTGNSRSTTTDSEGNFRMEDVPEGDWELVISDGTGAQTTRQVRVDANQENDVGSSQCRTDFGTIQGRVCNEATETWVVDATVSVTVPGLTVAATTDQDGAFRLQDVPVGMHTVVVEKGAFTETYENVEVVALGNTVAGDSKCGDTGSVRGRACGGDGFWLPGATVGMEGPGGVAYTTTSDANGYYELTDVPPGEYTLIISKGSFVVSAEITVTAGSVTEIPEDTCVTTTGLIAVVQGAWDHAETILSSLTFVPRAFHDASGERECSVEGEILGGEPCHPLGVVDLIEGEHSDYWLDFLADSVRLSQYDIIFINCGVYDPPLIADDPRVDIAAGNLKYFVESEGGSLYVSDQSYWMVEKAFPERIDFYGDDTEYRAPLEGQRDFSQELELLDPDLIGASGGEATVEIPLDFGGWAVMEPTTEQPGDLFVLSKAEVKIDDPAFPEISIPGLYIQQENTPMLVTFAAGAGRVTFTSFHHESSYTESTTAWAILNYVVFLL